MFVARAMGPPTSRVPPVPRSMSAFPRSLVKEALPVMTTVDGDAWVMEPFSVVRFRAPGTLESWSCRLPALAAPVSGVPPSA